MFGRLMNVIRGFFAQFVSGVEKRNPEALLELEQENLRKQIGSYNQSLAVHAGLAERLIGQVRKLETEENDLRARTTAHLRAGNKDAAAQHALRLQTVTRELEENRKQMVQAEETYKNLVKARDVAVSAARAKIQSLKGAINDLRMKTALAEMNEMAAGMVTQIGGSGDTLNLKRSGVKGAVHVSEDSIKVDVELGLMMSAMSGMIKAEIEKALDKALA